MGYYSLARPLLFSLAAETAHRTAIGALKYRLVPPQRLPQLPRLQTSLFGLEFPNPIGLAPGFDKNAECIPALLSQSFGFVEVGTVTPRPQEGNPKPRMFRLAEDEAVINRLGFNNGGMERFVANLKARPKRGIVGANIGKNKDSEDAVADYVTLLEAVAPHADYVTVNISSPNTQNLRALQERESLDALLTALLEKRTALNSRIPLLLKIAPDLTAPQLEDIAQVALARGIDGVIISNTTISRPPGLMSAAHAEQGGLSGRPLMPMSTAVLRNFYRLTEGKMPLIGVGGIASGEDAYAKIRAGASLVQLYSALVYQGFGLIGRIALELDALLARDGFSHVRDAVGTAN